jgi:hypothetical protein
MQVLQARSHVRLFLPEPPVPTTDRNLGKQSGIL